MMIKKKTETYNIDATKKRIFVQRSLPGLAISPEGIEDNSTYFGLGFMPWEDIESILYYEADGYYIGIFLHDVDKYKQGASFIKKIGMFINQKVATKAPVNINGSNLKEPLIKILASLYSYIPAGQEDKIAGFTIEDIQTAFPEIIEFE